jgi:hypothetical protein
MLETDSAERRTQLAPEPKVLSRVRSLYGNYTGGRCGGRRSSAIPSSTLASSRSERPAMLIPDGDARTSETCLAAWTNSNATPCNMDT